LQAVERRLAERPSDPPPAEYLCIRQAAAFAGLSSTKIRREIKAGRLPASDAGTPRRSHYRIRRADLEAWMEKNKGGSRLPPRKDISDLVARYFGSDD
jgi:excisionase family DNA binding protein